MVVLPEPKKKKCPACFGTGVQTNNDGLRVRCPVCNGSGKARIPDHDGPIWMGGKTDPLDGPTYSSADRAPSF